MARIARSAEPLFQTRGDPISWRVALTVDEDGPAIDLTGASAAATLLFGETKIDLAVPGTLGPDGIVLVTAPSSATSDLPLGNRARLHLAVTDSQGAKTNVVWPVIGETP